jgi:diaminopimelate epimerase
MKFTKMHGLGNDYVYVNCFEETLQDPAQVARFVSDRHFGIGSDGLILICPSLVADFRMVMFNADGSQAQMCGNGVRCVGKYVHDRGLTDKTTVTVETGGGIKTLHMTLDAAGVVSAIRVDMGAPILTPAQIPVQWTGDRLVDQPVELAGKQVSITAVSMGNPHCVVFLEESVADLDLPKLGPVFEHNPMFPERTNTEFIHVVDDHTLQMRVWERGAGETLACGTGACAALVAGVLCGKCARAATLQLLGGDLEIQWDEATDHVFMTGPANFVFDGEITLPRDIE